jgi:protein-tyrosine phosphatase
VHCKAGRERGATIALCWLMYSRCLSPEEGNSLLRTHRPHVSPHLAQLSVVRRFYAEQCRH